MSKTMTPSGARHTYHLVLNGRPLCRNPHANFAVYTVAAFKAEETVCKRCAAKVSKMKAVA